MNGWKLLNSLFDISSQNHIVVFSEVDSNSSNKYNTCTSFFLICVINCMNSSDAVLAFFMLFIYLLLQIQ